MIDEKKTLGELLSDPRIGKSAPDAIRNRDLSKEEVWEKTPAQLRDEHFFFGDVGRGFRRLFNAADTGDWYYPLYSEAECTEDEARRNVNMVWFPSGDPEADERPFILLVPGGGFVNVWNLTEGWPVAAQFNSEGYHVFILTYQVDGEERLLEKNLGDIARALRLIKEKEKHFHLQADRYITCGFSSGGMLVCLWNTEMGYPAFQLAKPEASFPIYPFVSLKLAAAEYASEEEAQEDTEEDEREDIRLYGCPFQEAREKPCESPEHAGGFPPCAIFVMAGDELVGHSKLLAGSLEKLHIPCRLEIGPEGGHGFADGTGTCIAGWTERAVRWYEEVSSTEKKS